MMEQPRFPKYSSCPALISFVFYYAMNKIMTNLCFQIILLLIDANLLCDV